MNDRECRLNRLFAAARTAPPDAPEAMPASLQTRALARWRAGAAAQAVVAVATMFRGALVCAAVIMLLSIAWSLSTHDPEDDVAIANYDLHTMMP